MSRTHQLRLVLDECRPVDDLATIKSERRDLETLLEDIPTKQVAESRITLHHDDPRTDQFGLGGIYFGAGTPISAASQ